MDTRAASPVPGSDVQERLTRDHIVIKNAGSDRPHPLDQPQLPKPPQPHDFEVALGAAGETPAAYPAIYGPSTELTGSIAQILDQRYHLVSEFANMQRASRFYDIESIAVQLCIIAGQSPKEPDQAKSFELFRDSLTTVDIVTFDELLERTCSA